MLVFIRVPLACRSWRSERPRSGPHSSPSDRRHLWWVRSAGFPPGFLPPSSRWSVCRCNAAAAEKTAADSDEAASLHVTLGASMCCRKLRSDYLSIAEKHAGEGDSVPDGNFALILKQKQRKCNIMLLYQGRGDEKILTFSWVTFWEKKIIFTTLYFIFILE